MGPLSDTVYRQLRAVAQKKLASQRAGHTLQPTALVNEAWLKLRNHFDAPEPTPEFFKTAAEAMRQVLVDHARRRNRQKRGGGMKRAGVEVEEVAEADAGGGSLDFDRILRLNDAVTRIEQLDAQAAAVVKLRFFAGLTVEETASALDISERSVKRDWSFARAWLARELSAPE
jgi:RNA polymerase sigma factor (TIGR02999 family)